MKILEAQSGVLTNYEVFVHLTELKTKSKGAKGRRPGNFETIVREILEYFLEAPSPLGSKPLTYNENTIRELLTKLRKFNLTKGEIIMIMNLRPTGPANLGTIIEEMELRFPDDDQQEEIVATIAEVLGSPDGDAEKQEMEENVDKAKQDKVLGNQGKAIGIED